MNATTSTVPLSPTKACVTVMGTPLYAQRIVQAMVMSVPATVTEILSSPVIISTFSTKVSSRIAPDVASIDQQPASSIIASLFVMYILTQ